MKARAVATAKAIAIIRVAIKTWMHGLPCKKKGLEICYTIITANLRQTFHSWCDKRVTNAGNHFRIMNAPHF